MNEEKLKKLQEMKMFSEFAVGRAVLYSSSTQKNY